MDTKPWKLNVFSKHRDENFVNIGHLKAIHQRNISSPALTSTLLPHKPLPTANPARRPAFADISNQSRLTHLVDQAKLKPTASVLTEVKLIKPLADVSSHPTQRPLSVAPRKPSISEAAKIHATTLAAIGNLYDTAPKKSIIKRHTTVFHENVPSKPLQSQPDPVSDFKIPSIPSPPATSSQNSDEDWQSVLTYTDANATGGIRIPTSSTNAPDPKLLLNESATCDASLLLDLILPTLRSENVSATVDILPLAVPTHIEPSRDVTKQVHPIIAASAPTTLPAPASTAPVLLRSKAIPNATSVFEQAYKLDDDYYDEDDDEEYFDADGGVAAGSYDSFGISTKDTSVRTQAILNPMVDSHSECELRLATTYVENHPSITDLEEDACDANMVAEYSEEIFAYMREIEQKLRPNPCYMNYQGEIDWSMRSVLIDWVAQVHYRFNLLPETLFLAVNYIDRYLSAKICELSNFQLMGITALWIAAKYEEINCPAVQEIVFMVDENYSVDAVLKAERAMLNALHFDLGWPGPLSFLRRASKADEYDVPTRTLSKYLLEVCLIDERFVATAPSYLAAGCHCLSRMILRKGSWTPGHIYFTRYTYTQLEHVMAVVLACLDQPRRHHTTIYEKYASRRYMRISLHVEHEILNGFKLPSPPPMGAIPSESRNSNSWLRKTKQQNESPAFGYFSQPSLTTW